MPFGFEKIHSSAAFGLVDEVRQLLEQDSDMANARDRTGDTPLHWAAGGSGAGATRVRDFSRQRQVTELLIAHGADVNAKDDRGETPLHVASRNDLHEVAEVLLAHGADAGAVDHHGMTPLRIATGSETRELLEKHGRTSLDNSIDVRCPSCDSVLPESAIRCKRCGHRLT